MLTQEQSNHYYIQVGINLLLLEGLNFRWRDKWLDKGEAFALRVDWKLLCSDCLRIFLIFLFLCDAEWITSSLKSIQCQWCFPCITTKHKKAWVLEDFHLGNWFCAFSDFVRSLWVAGGSSCTTQKWEEAHPHLVAGIPKCKSGTYSQSFFCA